MSKTKRLLCVDMPGYRYALSHHYIGPLPREGKIYHGRIRIGVRAVGICLEECPGKRSPFGNEYGFKPERFVEIGDLFEVEAENIAAAKSTTTWTFTEGDPGMGFFRQEKGES